jgi:hypothetical protein
MTQLGMRRFRNTAVMPGFDRLDPGIHVFLSDWKTKETWMAGINPAMT